MRPLTLTLCAAIVAVLLFCGIDAWAQPAYVLAATLEGTDIVPLTQTSPWGPVWVVFVQYLLPPLSAVLSAILLYLLKLLATKLGIQISADQEEVYRKAIRAAVAGVEEKYAAETKAGDPKPESLVKYQDAADAVMAQFPKILPEDLRRMIHEELGAVSGAGATGESKVG